MPRSPHASSKSSRPGATDSLVDSAATHAQSDVAVHLRRQYRTSTTDFMGKQKPAQLQR
jgi:hypothetical protein